MGGQRHNKYLYSCIRVAIPCVTGCFYLFGHAHFSTHTQPDTNTNDCQPSLSLSLSLSALWLVQVHALVLRIGFSREASNGGGLGWARKWGSRGFFFFFLLA